MDPDLQDLLAVWLGDHDPGEDRRTVLAARLRTDAAFRTAFADEISLLGKLRAVQSAEPRWLRLEDEIGWSARRREDGDGLAARVVEAALRRNRVRRAGRWSAVAVALAVVIVAVGVGIGSSTRRAPPGPAGPSLDLATVVSADATVWADGSAAVDYGRVVATGRYRLTSGRLTLEYFSGVSLTVEGPADFELLAADRVVCHFGKLRARVPRGAEGFTVLSGRYEVVDLGTEFAVNRDPGGAAQVMVFEGDAAVSVVGADGQSSGRGTVLEKQQAVELDPVGSRIRDVPPRPEDFVPLGKFAAEPLALAVEYPAAVLADRPWGYWRFETLTDGRVPNEVPGGPVLTPTGGVALDGPAGNRTALFRPDDAAQSYRLDGFHTLAQAGDYAVEVWAQSDLSEQDSSLRNALVSLIDRRDDKGEKHVAYLELTDRGRRSPHEPCSARFVDRWPAEAVGGGDLMSRRTVVPTLWRHLVGQKVGDRLELYVDGELIGTTPVKRTPALMADEPTIECSLLVGRLKRKSVSPKDYQIRAFQGRLDELAVYDHALTADDIRGRARFRLEVRR